jgi:PKD repeat protein
VRTPHNIRHVTRGGWKLYGFLMSLKARVALALFAALGAVVLFALPAGASASTATATRPTSTDLHVVANLADDISNNFIFTISGVGSKSDSVRGGSVTEVHTYDFAVTCSLTAGTRSWYITGEKGMTQASGTVVIPPPPDTCSGSGGGSGGSGGGTPPPSNSAPSAHFTFTKNGQTVKFTSTSTDDGTIVASTWNFGDGNVGSGTSVTHTYTQAGTYTVKLTVTDNGGKSSTKTAQVTVSGSTPPPNGGGSGGSGGSGNGSGTPSTPTVPGNTSGGSGSSSSASGSGSNGTASSGTSSSGSSVPKTSSFSGGSSSRSATSGSQEDFATASGSSFGYGQLPTRVSTGAGGAVKPRQGDKILGYGLAGFALVMTIGSGVTVVRRRVPAYVGNN